MTQHNWWLCLERKEQIFPELIRLSSDLGIRGRKGEESMSDLQPDNRIGEAKRSRFEGQAEHILGYIDVGVVTHLDGKNRALGWKLLVHIDNF